MLNATREGVGGCRTLGGRVPTVDGLDVKGGSSWCLTFSPFESRAAQKYHPAFPRNSRPSLPDPGGVWRNWIRWWLLENCLLSHLNSPPSVGRVLGWVCISVCQKEISSCAERQAWGSVWQSLGHPEGQLPRKWFSRWVWHWVPAHTLTPLTAFFASLLNILKGWLCRLFLWLLFWQSIAPWCQLNLSNKKEANVKF